ncbi:ricin-type beta-trefoil lectin domain protein [Streptomyces sp. NPDC127079]|uniref:ricin-type beta-trefoil lectin domain protein n=1 Tax=Streptomyces sp. NPDC127079 TaxID=3347132 RepID=UPI003666D945
MTTHASGAAINPCTGGAEQSWSYDGKGSLKGVNGYLTVGSSGLAASADFTGDASQRRLLSANGQILSASSGKCLDVSGQASADGSKVILYSCNGRSNEVWNRQ